MNLSSSEMSVAHVVSTSFEMSVALVVSASSEKSVVLDVSASFEMSAPMVVSASSAMCSDIAALVSTSEHFAASVTFVASEALPHFGNFDCVVELRLILCHFMKLFFNFYFKLYLH